MIMRENNQKPNQNPFSKVEVLRGFNNTADNIRAQMDNTRNPFNKNTSSKPTQTPSGYDPAKHRDSIARQNRERKWK